MEIRRSKTRAAGPKLSETIRNRCLVVEERRRGDIESENVKIEQKYDKIGKNANLDAKTRQKRWKTVKATKIVSRDTFSKGREAEVTKCCV